MTLLATSKWIFIFYCGVKFEKFSGKGKGNKKYIIYYFFTPLQKGVKKNLKTLGHIKT